MEHSTTALANRGAANRGILALEDGRCFPGVSVGFEGISTGEVIFNTAMTGYQEIITDPSYAGQIVVMTTPQIGNTGVNPEDDESGIKPPIRGLLMRELSTRTSNWRATESLSGFLQRQQIVALSEIDARSLTRHLRQHGTQRAVIASGDWDSGDGNRVEELIQKAKELPRLEESDFVETLTVPQPTEWSEPGIEPVSAQKTVVYDFGVKRSLLRSWALQGKVVLVPATTSAEDVLTMKPDSVVFSNGPGDPARRTDIVAEAAKLMGKVPIYGVGFGHQLLGIALGAKTHRLPFGHHGTQPVLHKQTGKALMTAQNHHFCLLPESLPPEVEITHINLNDGTIEGFRHRALRIDSVQFEC